MASDLRARCGTRKSFEALSLRRTRPRVTIAPCKRHSVRPRLVDSTCWSRCWAPASAHDEASAPVVSRRSRVDGPPLHVSVALLVEDPDKPRTDTIASDLDERLADRQCGLPLNLS